ncbi:rabankyrin-5 [Coccinella septempunctata]|uniref:rabankyrin-5 n=1 Tax=Coccinella septempunctata TaxID=41139 RepID=UPI001D09733A|nr:rabankyrin-5 [Coccinella septempunctata]
MGDNSEIKKLQNHLALLKDEYSKLQKKYNEVEIKYNAMAASSGNSTEDTFAFRLLNHVSHLYGSPLYSDIKIKLYDKDINAHKLVLSARSDLWNESVLSNKEELDWSDIDTDVGTAIVKWIYTSCLEVDNVEFTLNVLKKAHELKLNQLVESCEQYLISNVNIRNCVKLYTVAEMLNAERLLNYCSGLLSTHWNDLNASDFEDMSGPLLYKMLKSKTTYPLHAAIKLDREDVVFLCLVENSAKLKEVVNAWSDEEELPLELALRSKNESLANSLIQHNSDVNIRDKDGEALLHRAIRRKDTHSILFLLDNKADTTLTTPKGKETPLHLLASSGGLDQADVIAEKMLRSGVSINAQNSQGLSALHITIQSDNKQLFKILLEQSGVNLNLKTQDDHSPLYYALLRYEEDHDQPQDTYANLLVERNVVTDSSYPKRNNESLLQVVTSMGLQESSMFLTAHVANVDHVNQDGGSALHTACARNLGALTMRLLERGANPNLQTYDAREAPLHLCVSNKSLDCIEAFIKFNENVRNGVYKDDEVEKCLVDFDVRDAEGDTPIMVAVNKGHGYNEVVLLLIKGKADVNIRNNNDFTLLHQAIMKEDVKTSLFLLENGADVNAETPDSESPLQLAIHCRLGEVVDALCSRGVDMSARDKSGNCPLWAALETEQFDIASILVRHGVDTDCWSEGPDKCQQTLLHQAIDENKEGAAIFLIQAGCDIDCHRLPGPNGEGGEEARDKASPLHLCCQWGLDTVVRTLIEHRANVNNRDAENKTPLHIAIENKQDDIISLLLAVPEIDLSLRDKNGLSPFATALTFRNNKAAQVILGKMPNAAEQFDSKGQNFLHVAIKKKDIESVLFLLTVNVDVNSRVQDAMLTPPLHLAAQHGDETMVRSLILAGARVDDRNTQKRTALHVAAEEGNAPVVSALLQNNADCDAVDCESDNALHIAVRSGNLAVVKVLLTESTIDAGAFNLKGRNPLHELCKYGKENAAAICDFFLECMPDYQVDKPDINGNSPLLLAYMKGNANLCRSLVKANVCLGTENNEKISIFNYQVPSKHLLNRLLDQLSQPPKWTHTDLCQECGKGFSITARKHHCRHCGRALCSRCSDQEVPILKFGENKPVKVCNICFDVLKGGIN